MVCVLCDLLCSGTARWSTRETYVAAFAPLRPLAPGPHALVIPTDHYADIFDTPLDPRAEAMALIPAIHAAIPPESVKRRGHV